MQYVLIGKIKGSKHCCDGVSLDEMILVLENAYVILLLQAKKSDAFQLLVVVTVVAMLARRIERTPALKVVRGCPAQCRIEQSLFPPILLQVAAFDVQLEHLEHFEVDFAM